LSQGASPYGERFFASIQAGARASARRVIPLLREPLDISSVADFGCGRGAWLAEWQAAGVEDVQGVDGPYVTEDQLLVDPDRFAGHDLEAPVDLGRRFDLVQCLEVAEHLAPCHAGVIVDTLVRHGDAVLFSAAVPGQGGKHHVNERPLDFWRRLFRDRGYRAVDAVRPHLGSTSGVEPWYRYNTLLYLSEARLEAAPTDIRDALLPEDAPIPYPCSLGWRVRLALVRPLPRGVVDWIATLKERLASSG
jgi:hypothetical protein